MLTVHKLTAGEGHRYYTHEVATGDSLRSSDRELGDYYTIDGLPPGQWVGAGAAELGLKGNVSEEQMEVLFGHKFTPLETEEITDLLQNSTPEAFEEVRSEAWNKVHQRAAERAFIIIEGTREGKSQQEICSDLEHLYGRVPSQMTVSKYLARYRAAGHRIVKGEYLKNPDAPRTDRAEFMASYRLLEHEATQANHAAQRAIDEHFQQKVAPNLHAQRDGSTEFTRAVDEEIRRFRDTKHTDPTAEEMKEIRHRVGAVLYRQQHGVDPTDKQLISFIARESKQKSNSVAGFDMVFTPPKSVSLAWGLGDESLREGVQKAHEAAISDVVKFLEEQVIMTRRGAGGVRQIDIDGGLIATKFRHWDSRSGDPNLHDHLVISNRVKGSDGQWSAIDGRTLYQWNVAASELYNAKLAEYLEQNLGLVCVPDAAKSELSPVMEIAGFDREMVERFSSRRSEISAELDRLKEQYVETHGHAPGRKAMLELAQQATLATRPHKSEAKSLKNLCEEWAAKAETISRTGEVNIPTGEDLKKHLEAASEQARAKREQTQTEFLSRTPEEHAQQILDRVTAQRAVFRRSHVEAETARYLRGAGFPVPVPGTTQTTPESTDEQSLSGAIHHALEQKVLHLSGEQNRPVADEFLRADGTSSFVRRDATLFTTQEMVDAELRILDAATAPVIPAATFDVFEQKLQERREKLAEKGFSLPAGQEALAREFALSERLLVAGIGAAGAGKTASVSLAVETIQAAGGRVIGMAPTAAAAKVLGDELGIGADTVAKVLAANTNGAKSGPLSIRPGDVLLIDEAGMVSTRDFDALVQIAAERGALVRVLGDDRQLSAVGAGGALRLIDREVGAVRLDELFRFKNEEEAAATLRLREPVTVGKDEPFEWYREQGRVVGGDGEAMTQKVFAAWQKDISDGKTSLMMGSSNESVAALNALAQAHRISTSGEQTGEGVILRPGSAPGQGQATAFAGDVIVTRRNDRRLSVFAGHDFVKNGDRWSVEGVGEDGSLQVRHVEHGGTVTLPAAYVRENVELGYALTVHRAQGATVDTAHALIDSRADRAGAYVGLSRGREENRLYVRLNEGEKLDEVLETVAARHDGEAQLSVHESVDAIRAQQQSPAAAVAEYEEHAELAQRAVIADLMTQGMNRVTHFDPTGADAAEARSLRAQMRQARYDGADTSELEAQMPTGAKASADADVTAVINSEGFGALAAQLGELHRAGLDVPDIVERAYRTRPLSTDAETPVDAAAVLSWRVSQIVDERANAERADRPLAGYSDAMLDSLIARAEAREVSTEARLEKLTLDDPEWFRNPFAMAQTDWLLERRAATVKALNTCEREDGGTHRTAKYDEIAETLGQMDAEITRRRWEVSGDQREFEQIIRGEVSRGGERFTLAACLREERRLRRELGLTAQNDVPKPQPSKVTSGGVSGHTLDRFWENQLKGGKLKAILKARASEIGKLTRSRGQELARQVREGKAPAWVQNLGPVPTRRRAFRKWARAVGEIDAMRTKYGVPDSHPEPLPRELVREAGQRVNNKRLAAEGAPVSAGSRVRTRAAEAVLGVWEQVKSVAKTARLSKRAGEQSQAQGQSPAPEATAEPRQQQSPAPQQSPTGEAAQPETRKEKPVSETEERLRQERAARAERARQMMERTRSLDERLRDQPAPQASQQQSAQQNLQRQRQQQQAQQMHEQARRGVRGPGL
ncbi:MobF family relaxase [Rothia mucilaginosa]|uniref:MobF family relaxase n=1 Tax=Rothia mucilaginosa TaxID=43675 RepID=UPI0026EA7222|nr:MobF family relaxase [Rothia mucilaginosa]